MVRKLIVLIYLVSASPTWSEDLSSGPYGITCEFDRLCYAGGECVETENAVDLDVWSAELHSASIIGQDIESDGVVQIRDGGIEFTGSDAGDTQFTLSVGPNMEGRLSVQYSGEFRGDVSTGTCYFYR